ncbi:CatB-related O-acetyltransferase, partial [Methylobacterium trifolii]
MIPDRIFDKLVVPRLRARQFESPYLREQFARRYGIEIGLYSYGCFDRWRIPRGTRIGRYCSFSGTARILNANHPIDAISTHPFLYDPAYGIVGRSQVKTVRTEVEDDVWFGHNSVVLPGAQRIGRGSIIGAGAVVTGDVPRYAIMAGVPARLVRYRFDAAAIDRLEASAWWRLSRSELKAHLGAADAPGAVPAPALA